MGSVTAFLFVLATCTSCVPLAFSLDYGLPEVAGTVQHDGITEASGIIASRANPGCFYINNDSGDSPRVFLVSETGETKLVIRLRGVTAVDYEDIAIAPGAKPGTYDVCVADIGDNRAIRSDVRIYRFPEVDASAYRAGATTDIEPVMHRVRYAGGPSNAEGLFVHPRTGDGYIITKPKRGNGVVYKLPSPWKTDEITELAKVAELALPTSMPLARTITAADISPDGRRIAVRCYVQGWEWELPADAKDESFVDVFGLTPAQLGLAVEKQGEAICYTPDGRALFTVSEGVHPKLWKVVRQKEMQKQAASSQTSPVE